MYNHYTTWTLHACTWLVKRVCDFSLYWLCTQPWSISELGSLNDTCPVLWLFETQLFVSADRSSGQQRQREKKKEIEQKVKKERTEREWEKDREISPSSDAKFTHLLIIHAMGRLTEKLERKLCQPAAKVCICGTLSIPLPIVALSSQQSTTRPSDSQTVKSICVSMQRN